MDNTCIRCGRIIPEGRHICLLCEHDNETQSFRAMPGKRRFRIIDDCGWEYIVETDRTDLLAADIVLLVPHVRSAAEITEGA